MASYNFGYWEFGSAGGILNVGDTITLGAAVSSGTVFLEDDDPYMHDADALSGTGGDSTKATLTAPLDSLGIGDEIGTGYRYLMTGSDGSTIEAFALFSYQDLGFYLNNYLIFNGQPNPSVTYTITLIDPTPYVGMLYDDLGSVCFCSGSKIKTSRGEIPVEELKMGDLVTTRDKGFQKIRWVGSKKCDAIDLAVNRKLHPIRIKANALGDGFPEKDLMVSRQHRMLIKSKIALRMFGCHEILVPAIKLIGMDGIDILEDQDAVEYFHILFDEHEIIYANNTPSESFYLGDQALDTVSKEQLQELKTLFPEIVNGIVSSKFARQVVQRNKIVQNMLMRHTRNNKPLYSTY